MDDWVDVTSDWPVEDDRQDWFDFRVGARQIVKRAQDSLLRELRGKLKPKLYQELERLPGAELVKVEEKVQSTFATQEMGLQKLSVMARRELGMLAIKRSVDKYSVSMLDGNIGPVEYFNRFYRESFILFGIKSGGINFVDPNLQAQLKKRGEFSEITKSLSMA